MEPDDDGDWEPSSTSRVHGWTRTVAVTIVVAMVAPLVVGTVAVVRNVTSGQHGLPASSATDLIGVAPNVSCEDVRADPAFASAARVLRSVDFGAQLRCELAVATTSAVARRIGVPANCAVPEVDVPVDIDKASARWRVRPTLVAFLTRDACRTH